jgi:hypothetical protein
MTCRCAFMILLALLLAGCTKSTELPPAPLVEQSAVPAQEQELKEIVTDAPIDARMVGCWSNGRGEVLRIVDGRSIYGSVRKTIKDSPEPVKFVQIQLNPNSGTLLKFVDRPLSYVFRPYTHFQIGTDKHGYTTLDFENFESFADFINNKNSGYGSWIKGECSSDLYPKWFEKHYDL